MCNIKKRSRFFLVVNGGIVGLVMLTLGGLSLQAQTTTIAPGTVISSINETHDYIFSDGGGNTRLNPSIGPNITMKSITAGGNHQINIGSRTLTVTSGTIAFQPTGTDATYSIINGGNITTSSNLNITNSKNGAAIGSSIIGSNSVTVTSTNNTRQFFFYGQNSYTGGTIINSGDIRAGTTSAFGGKDGGVVTLNGGGTTLQAANVIINRLVMNGGTLSVASWAPGTFTQSAIGTLALTSNSTIVFTNNGAESYSFADSRDIDWTGNLILNGFALGTDYIRFGNNGNALTGTQLSRIKLNGNPSFQFGLDSNGFLIAAIPEPSTYAMLLVTILVVGFAYRRKLA